MATIQEINHDSSTTISDHYDTIVDNDNALSATAGSRLDLSTNGVDADYTTGTEVASLRKNITTSTDDIRFRFRIKLDNLSTLTDAQEIMSVWIRTSGNVLFFEIRITSEGTSNNYNVRVFYNRGPGKGGSFEQLGTGNDDINSTGEVCIELRAIRETASPGSDGEIELYIDGSSIRSSSTVDNRVRWDIDHIFVEFDASTSATGNLFYDQYLLDDDNTLSTMCTDATDEFALILGGGQP